MKRVICAVLAFIFLLCGCGNTKSDSGESLVGADREANSTISMRNMSFNIRYNEFEEERINLVFTMIEKYAPDTIGFQEATVEWMKVLKERLGDKYGFIGVGREANNTDEACPVFYHKDKFELIDGDTKWLSKTPDIEGSKLDSSSMPRIVTYALLEDKATGKQFIAANTHLHHQSEEARIDQAGILLELLDDFNTKKLPVVLTGDFNCYIGSEPYKVITNMGYSNASYIAKTAEKGATYHNYGKKATVIDYIFVPSYCVDVDYYKVCNETFTGSEGTIYPSDHNPIIIDAKYRYGD